MRLEKESTDPAKVAITHFVIAILATYICHLMFAVFSDADNMGSAFGKALFFFAMGTIAPLLIIAKAAWHVILAAILAVGATVLIIKKLVGGKRVCALIVILLSWQLYGLMCVSIYIGA